MNDVIPVPTVFVVDDDASVRRALARLFTSWRLRVETFADAHEFFARAPSGEPGCLLLDIKMPKTTGLDLQRQLETVGIEMPVIFLSAHADVALTVRAMKAGALEVFTKPFREAALLAAVYQAIALDEARHRERAEYSQLRRRFDSLTPRQQTVMSLVVTGKLNKQIASIIGTSLKTVKVHRARAMVKMQAASLPQLVRMADRLGLGPENAAASEGVPKVP
jgi:FixJ family two-component response regulator